MKEHAYIDGIESISVVDGVVRLETFVFKPGEKKEGQPTPEHSPSIEIMMSLNGLARLHDGVGRLIDDIKTRQRSAQGATGSDNFPPK